MDYTLLRIQNFIFIYLYLIDNLIKSVNKLKNNYSKKLKD